MNVQMSKMEAAALVELLANARINSLVGADEKFEWTVNTAFKDVAVNIDRLTKRIARQAKVEPTL